MPGVSGVTVVTNARVYYTPRAAAGASGARHSLRPLIFRGWDVRKQNSRGLRGEIAKLWLEMMRCLKNESKATSPAVIVREKRKQTIQYSRAVCG
jgi:hypothetical protein